MKKSIFKRVFVAFLAFITLLTAAGSNISSFVYAEDNQEVVYNAENPFVLEETSQIDDITVTVKGRFGEKGHLHVEKVKKDGTLSNDNVVGSYTFDIKVLNDNGEELQPLEPVVISFGFAEIDNNLNISVFHEEESIEHVVENNTVTVASEGFSHYTVEFTYEGKQFVLAGEGVIKLVGLLEQLGLSGEVTSHAVSNAELFTIMHGNAEGLAEREVEYNETGDTHVRNEYVDDPEGEVAYLVSLRPFNTIEWLDVTVNGVNYHIVVTDDYIDNQGQTVAVDGVVQGGNETNFTENMHLATIFIDENIINQSVASRNNSIPKLLNDYENYSEFVFKNPTGYEGSDSVYLSLDVNAAADNGRPLNGGSNSADNGGNTLYPGDVIQYTFKNGALKIDPYSGEEIRYDVVITYSNLNITLDQYLNRYNGLYLGICAGNLIGIGASQNDGSRAPGNFSQKYAIKVDANIKVIDPVTGQVVDGEYYYPMVDIDVKRTDGFRNFYNASAYNNYSEQVMLYKDNLASDVFIPGGDFDSTNPANSVTNMPYLSAIEEDTANNALLFKPDATYGSATGDSGITRDNDFYTGFATLVNNTDGGLNLTYWGSSASLTGTYYKQGVNSYLLSGKLPINHLLVSSSGEGGNITTTRFGNHNGLLDDGSVMYPATDDAIVNLAVATGQTVVYTMLPEDGYHLKNVKVSREYADIGRVNEDVTTSVTTVTMPDGKTGYIFEFSNIANDGAIKVEWERDPQDLTLTKKTVNNTEGSFDFEIILKKKFKVEGALDKTEGSQYSAHDDDLMYYRINMNNYTYRFFDQNTQDFRSKRSGNPSNNGWSRTIGTAGALGMISEERTVNGRAILRLNSVAKDPQGNARDVVILFDQATITPNTSISANNTELFHGGLNGSPAFIAGDTRDQDIQYNNTASLSIYDFSVLGHVKVYITEPGYNDPLEGSYMLSFADVKDMTYGNETISEEVTVNSVVQTPDSNGRIEIVTQGQTDVTMKTAGLSGLIYIMNQPQSQHELALNSGANGKIQVCTDGNFEDSGAVSNTGKILEKGTYGVKDGKSVTVRLLGDAGYEVDTVTVNGADATTQLTERSGIKFLTLDNITQDQSVNVTWKAIPNYQPEDEPAIYEYRYYKLEDGSIQESEYKNAVTLKNGESKTWSIPYGWEYEIKEKAKDKWKLVSSTNTTGTITTSAVNSEFTNLRYFDLNITKRIQGKPLNQNEDFNFTLEIRNSSNALTDLEEMPAALTKIATGQYSFTLKDLESVKVVVPAGYKYKVTEALSSNQSKYEVIVDGRHSDTSEGTVGYDKTVNYVNENAHTDIQIYKRWLSDENIADKEALRQLLKMTVTREFSYGQPKAVPSGTKSITFDSGEMFNQVAKLLANNRKIKDFHYGSEPDGEYKAKANILVNRSGVDDDIQWGKPDGTPIDREYIGNIVRYEDTSKGTVMYLWYDPDLEAICYWTDADKDFIFTSKNTTGMFKDMADLEYASGLNMFNTSRAETITDLFYITNASGGKLKNLDGLRNWDVSNITSLEHLFVNQKALSDIGGIVDWDIRKVVSSGNAASLNELFLNDGQLNDKYPFIFYPKVHINGSGRLSETASGEGAEDLIMDVDGPAASNYGELKDKTTFYWNWDVLKSRFTASDPAKWKYETYEDALQRYINIDGAVGVSNKKELVYDELNDVYRYTFANKYNTHKLTVSKTVAGNMGSRDKYFKFTLNIENGGKNVTLKADYANTVRPAINNNATNPAYYQDSENLNATGIREFTTDEEGKAEIVFYLQHGESVVIDGLIETASYTITEETEKGYKTYSVDAINENREEGTITTGEIGKQAERSETVDYYRIKEGVEATTFYEKPGEYYLDYEGDIENIRKYRKEGNRYIEDAEGTYYKTVLDTYTQLTPAERYDTSQKYTLEVTRAYTNTNESIVPTRISEGFILPVVFVPLSLIALWFIHHQKQEDEGDACE